MMYDYYIAGALHDKADREANSKIAKLLRDNSMSCYVPQEYGVWEEMNIPYDEAQIKCVSSDMEAMQNSTGCIAVYDREKKPSEGMLWELGWFYAMNKPIYIYNPRKYDFNPMIKLNCTAMCYDLDTLKKVLGIVHI